MNGWYLISSVSLGIICWIFVFSLFGIQLNHNLFRIFVLLIPIVMFFKPKNIPSRWTNWCLFLNTLLCFRKQNVFPKFHFKTRAYCRVQQTVPRLRSLKTPPVPPRCSKNLPENVCNMQADILLDEWIPILISLSFALVAFVILIQIFCCNVQIFLLFHNIVFFWLKIVMAWRGQKVYIFGSKH